MLQNIDLGSPLIPEIDLLNKNTMQVLAVFQHVDASSSLSDLSSKTVLKPENGTNKKDIFVCTFCQVFSPLCADIVQHITDAHSESLLPGTKPENFVSKLHSLQENAMQKVRKVGRPRKNKDKDCSIVEPSPPATEPVPGPDGLFWCKNCLRYFRKSRQLTQHICLDDDEDISSDEPFVESFSDADFKSHTVIDRMPWSRKGKHKKLKENSVNISTHPEDSIDETSKEISKQNAVLHWRNDPDYVPLFQNENEKSEFEEHLKSIDYSYVDDLYQKKEKKCRNNHKNLCGYVQSVVYSCNHCKRVSKSLSHIRLHCLTHTDFKPFTCPKCSYSTNSKGSLYMHMRKHTGNVFCCSYCDFKSVKRSHLLDHEATHSSVSHLCKLCKNSYKTLRSLIAHIRKYHNNPAGKRYAKSLTSKQLDEFKCIACKKKFKSAETLKIHNRVCHENGLACDTEQNGHDELQSEHNLDEPQNIAENILVNNSPVVQNSPEGMQCNNNQSKDPLAEIVLEDLLQEQSQTVMYKNTIFQQHNEDMLSSPSDSLLKSFQTKAMSENLTTDSSVLEECQKTLDLNILNECLRNSDLEVLQDSNISNECVQSFNLQPNISRRLSLQSSESSSECTQHLQELSAEKCEEPKSVEIKLFEKCKRAPAYVCCVCSAIYICPSTLKAHLKEHINNTNSNLIEHPDDQFESTKMSEGSTDLDKVCEILQDSAETCSYDEELEKLYTSSLDMMWYLPEVSVVLQNDPALFDRLLDDISNFPMSVNDSSQELDVKDTEESVLKCFDEL